MITGSDAGDMMLWLLFWLVQAVAVCWVIRDFLEWLKQEVSSRDGIQHFPREFPSDPGDSQTRPAA